MKVNEYILLYVGTSEDLYQLSSYIELILKMSRNKTKNEIKQPPPPEKKTGW